MREWDVGKNDKSKEVIRQDHMLREDRPPLEKRRHRTTERSPEPGSVKIMFKFRFYFFFFCKNVIKL